LVPYLDESVILGGAHFPTVGVVDSLRAGTLMRDSAQKAGALTVLAGTEVYGIAVEGGKVRSVTTSAGEILTDNVVICCGVWSQRIARMAGARMALTPTVHQMISVGPIALFADTPGEISYPIVRDVDTNMYERQHGGDMEVGSYAHRPIIVPPDEIPSIEESVLSPTEMPFTSDDFDPQLEQALELMPELLGDEKARPNVRTPTARAAGVADLEIVADSHEQYPYRFGGQQATVLRRALPCGDYGVMHDGRLVASVERKSLADLVAS